jgi:hypothetical protein
MWFFVEEPWQYRILDQLPPGLDRAQLERTLKMTPTERLEAVVHLIELGEALHEEIRKKSRRDP